MTLTVAESPEVREDQPAITPEPPPCCPGAVEQWVPVVTDTGPFRKWPHFTSDHGRYCTAAGKLLKLKASNRPHGGPRYYKLVTLCAYGTQHTYSAHRVELLSFAAAGHCPGPGPGEESSHLNDVPDDNHLSNLIFESHPANEARKMTQPGWGTPAAAAARSEHARRSRATDLARRAEATDRDREAVRHARSPFRRAWQAVTGHFTSRKRRDPSDHPSCFGRSRTCDLAYVESAGWKAGRANAGPMRGVSSHTCYGASQDRVTI